MEESGELDGILLTVFMHFSNSFSHSSENLLKLKDFLLICSEAQVQDSQVTSQKLDLLFRSLTHKSLMNFPVFVKSVSKISKLKYLKDYQEDPSNVHLKFIQNFFAPLAQKIMKKKEKMGEISQNIPLECVEILRNSIKPLKNLYFKLFPSEFTKKEFLKKSQKNLENFLKELEIFPGLISKKKLDLVWKELVLDQKDEKIAEKILPAGFSDIGECFTFSKFLLILHISSVLAYADSQFVESPSEKLLCVLERVNLGQDLNNFLIQSSPKDSFLSKTMSQSSLNFHRCDFFSTSSVLDENSSILIEEKSKSLHSLFLTHACNSSTSNLKQLKPAGFVKLLLKIKAAKKFNARCPGELVKPISIAEADLIFSKVSGTRASKFKGSYLDYNQFIEAVFLVSQKMFPLKSFNESFELFVSTFVDPAESGHSARNNETNEQDLMFLSKSAEISEISGIIKKPMIYYFKVYSGFNFLMTSAGFLRFCKDFEVFPDLISKTRLFSFFSIFADPLKTSEKSMSSSRLLTEKPKKSSEGCLDEDGFIQVLIIISLNISYEIEITENSEKICWFFERLSQSPGVEKVLKSYGHARLGKGESFDITSGLRVKFPDFFNRYECKQLKFSDLAEVVILS